MEPKNRGYSGSYPLGVRDFKIAYLRFQIEVNRKVKDRRGYRELARDVREHFHALVCIGCREYFDTGLGGTEAQTGNDVLIAAHANGWNVDDPDSPYCPNCTEKSNDTYRASEEDIE